MGTTVRTTEQIHEEIYRLGTQQPPATDAELGRL